MANIKNIHAEVCTPFHVSLFQFLYSIPKKSKPGLHYGRDLKDIPLVAVAEPEGEVAAAYTGPNAGLTALDPKCTVDCRESDVDIADCKNWNQPSEFAYGLALSLYEEDRSARETVSCPSERTHAAEASTRIPVLVGDPVADVFGVQVRDNMAVMAIADGSGWGVKPRLAARCAVRAVMEHVTASLSQIRETPTSHTIASVLLESVTIKAQELILEHNATLTTLSAAVVCQMAQPGQWGLFVVAVGDSPVYVYCPHTRKTHEVTVGCHPLNGDRDQKMAGGTLGPSLGNSPDLENLTVAFKTICEGDIVICASDGISDNFSGETVSKATGLIHPDIARGKVKKCCNSILHLNEVLKMHQEEMGSNMSAQTVVAKLMNYAAELTDQKRLFYSSCIEQGVNIKRKKAEDPEFAEQLEMLPGKLDHATVVAVQVGNHTPYSTPLSSLPVFL